MKDKKFISTQIVPRAHNKTVVKPHNDFLKTGNISLMKGSGKLAKSKIYLW